MHVNNFINNILSCQQEIIRVKETSQSSAHFQPKIYKRTQKPRVSFSVWSSRPFAFMGTKENLIGKVKDLNKGERMILSHLIYFRSKGIPMFMSQDYIAHKTGYSREYVNKRIKNLIAHGLVDKYNRGINKSNVYKVCSDFLKKDNWILLMNYLPAIRGLFLMLICMQPVLNMYPESFFLYAHYGRFKREFTVLKNKDFNLNINSKNNMVKTVSSLGSYLKSKPEKSKYKFDIVPIPKVEKKKAIRPKRTIKPKAVFQVSEKQPIEQTCLKLSALGEKIIKGFPEDVIKRVDIYIFHTQPAIYRRCSQLTIFKSFIRKCEEECVRRKIFRKPFDFNSILNAKYVFE